MWQGMAYSLSHRPKPARTAAILPLASRTSSLYSLASCIATPAGCHRPTRGYLFTGATARVGPGSGRGARRDARLAAAHLLGVALLWSAVLSGAAGGVWLKRGLLGSK
jgi:hypothetical protein